MRKIAIATGTRADWGLLSGIAKALAARADCEVEILATNMHLFPRYGNTINEITADGFDPVKVPVSDATDSPLGAVKSMSECMSGMAEAFERIKPDIWRPFRDACYGFGCAYDACADSPYRRW